RPPLRGQRPRPRGPPLPALRCSNYEIVDGIFFHDAVVDSLEPVIPPPQVLRAEVEAVFLRVSPRPDREPLRIVQVVEEDRFIPHVAVVPAVEKIGGDLRLLDL